MVDELGPGATRFRIGERSASRGCAGRGQCRFCLRGDENLCVAPQFTGWDADGGYAEQCVIERRYRLPERFTDDEAAPLLCAGIIGFRALRRAALPEHGRLGIYGFGASAHLGSRSRSPRAPPCT